MDSGNKHVTWEEYKDAVQVCIDGIRKAKIQMELNLERDAKKKKKGSIGMFLRRPRGGN